MPSWKIRGPRASRVKVGIVRGVIVVRVAMAMAVVVRAVTGAVVATVARAVTVAIVVRVAIAATVHPAPIVTVARMTALRQNSRLPS